MWYLLFSSFGFLQTFTENSTLLKHFPEGVLIIALAYSNIMASFSFEEYFEIPCINILFIQWPPTFSYNLLWN